ncbi:hypothetical protein EJB05_43193, partial [Eragrostis curvula]
HGDLGWHRRSRRSSQRNALKFYQRVHLEVLYNISKDHGKEIPESTGIFFAIVTTPCSGFAPRARWRSLRDMAPFLQERDLNFNCRSTTLLYSSSSISNSGEYMSKPSQVYRVPRCSLPLTKSPMTVTSLLDVVAIIRHPPPPAVPNVFRYCIPVGEPVMNSFTPPN